MKWEWCLPGMSWSNIKLASVWDLERGSGEQGKCVSEWYLVAGMDVQLSARMKICRRWKRHKWDWIGLVWTKKSSGTDGLNSWNCAALTSMMKSFLVMWEAPVLWRMEKVQIPLWKIKLLRRCSSKETAGSAFCKYGLSLQICCELIWRENG